MRRHAPATARNREPILEVLLRYVKEGDKVLEIASGTGEHAVFLAPALKVKSWQPSDPDPESRASIDAWRTDAPNVLPAIDLDVTKRPWKVERPDLVMCCNMIHISPFAACEALIAGSAELFGDAKGTLYLYGPYRRFGAHTSESNAAFDASLKSRDPSWGVRDLEDVVKLAEDAGYRLDDVVSMPANNFSVVFRRG